MCGAAPPACPDFATVTSNNREPARYSPAAPRPWLSRRGASLCTLVAGPTPPATSVADSGLPDPIKAVMSKPRYRNATWSLQATDLKIEVPTAPAKGKRP